MMSKRPISGVLRSSGSNSVVLQTHVGPDLHHRNCCQIAHAHQIVGRAGKSENPIYRTHSAMPHLTYEGNRLQPAEAFFDPLPLLLAEGVARVSRRAAVNRAAAPPPQVLRYMRRYPQIPALLHEIPRVKPFV